MRRIVPLVLSAFAAFSLAACDQILDRLPLDWNDDDPPADTTIVVTPDSVRVSETTPDGGGVFVVEYVFWELQVEFPHTPSQTDIDAIVAILGPHGSFVGSTVPAADDPTVLREDVKCVFRVSAAPGWEYTSRYIDALVARIQAENSNITGIGRIHVTMVSSKPRP